MTVELEGLLGLGHTERERERESDCMYTLEDIQMYEPTQSTLTLISPWIKDGMEIIGKSLFLSHNNEEKRLRQTIRRTIEVSNS